MSNHTSRCLGLDLLRVMAVVLVLFRHLYFPNSENHNIFRWLCNGGWVGVDVFFVLSGFLVSGLLFREYKMTSKIRIKRFLIRRGYKIYPPFWSLMIMTVLFAAIRNEMLSARSIISEFVFLQNYGSSLWNHTWSLAVEEHFYFLLVLWVFLIYSFFGGLSLKRVLISFIFVAVLCVILRVWTWQKHEQFSMKAHVFPTHLRIDSLMYGVLLSYLNCFFDLEARLALIPAWIFCVFGVLLLSPAYLFHLETCKWLSTYGFSVFYVGAGFMCLFAIRLRQSASVLLNLIGKIGASSYSVYLWHMPINVLMVKIFGDLMGAKYYWYVISYVVLSFVVGYFGSFVIEAPVIKFRNKNFS